MANAYSQAGVDVEAGYEVVRRISSHAARTTRLGVMGSLGGFGGCFDLSQFDLKEPVLVSGTDGVGTKLLVAHMAQIHNTIGIDCVAMCVNDIIAQGAEPLYFLDYIACGKNDPLVLEQVVAGVADGCVQAGAALIGGETAEMPGMYSPDEYDLAGFAVGLAEKSDLVTGEDVSDGHILIGLPSTGVHSNGFSLVRNIIFGQAGLRVDSPFCGKTVADVLLEPTRIYVNALLPLVKDHLIDGISHVTGGGFVENLPRMLPDGVAAKVDIGSWPVLEVFEQLQSLGNVPEKEMYEIFNMGVGMVLAVAPEKLERVQQSLTSREEPFFVIGQVIDHDSERVVLCG